MLTTERVRLRKMTIKDAEIYHRWRNDREVMTLTSPHLDDYTYEETESFVEAITKSSTSKTYIIEDLYHAVPIGVTSLIQLDYKNSNAECIIDIGNKQYWGKGYGKEAFLLLITYAFKEINLHRLSLKVFSYNERAIKLYENLGFKTEGVMKEALFRDGEWHDITLMRLFQNEFSNGDSGNSSIN